MNTGKNLLIITIFLSSLFSCQKDGCTNSGASNYDSKAKKDNGTCTYPQIIDLGALDPRDEFIGHYLVTDSLFIGGSFSEISTYILQVSAGGTISDTIYLNNLWNDGANYRASMAGNSFSIPSQQVSGPYYVSGNGNFVNSIINYQTSGDEYVNRGSGLKQ